MMRGVRAELPRSATVWLAAAAAVLACAIALVATPAGAAPDAFGARIEAELLDFARARAGVSPDAVRIPDLSDFELEALDPARTDIRLSVNSGNAWRGTVPVTVAIWEAGELRKRGVVTLRIVDRRRAWVAARDLAAGQPIERGDLRLETVDARRLPADALASADEVEGQVARRGVAAGAVLRKRWLARPARVERGALVMLRLERGALRIEGRGKARDEGAVGDWVRVRNLDSRRELVGRVAEDGVVDVRF